MLFNVDKCKVKNIGHNTMKSEYVVDGVKLELVTEDKDLGIRSYS